MQSKAGLVKGNDCSSTTESNKSGIQSSSLANTLHMSSIASCPTIQIPMTANMIPITINSTSKWSLVDTGAQVSCLQYSTYTQLGLSKSSPKVNSAYSKVRGVGGSLINVLGKAMIKINIEDFEIEQEFLLLDSMHHDIILGKDFLEDNRVLLDFSTGTGVFKLQQSLIEINMGVPEREEPEIKKIPQFFKVYATSRLQIPKNSSCTFNVHIQNKKFSKRTCSGLISGNKYLWKEKGILALNTAVTFNDKHACYTVVNPTEYTVLIDHTDVLGYFSRCEEDEFSGSQKK